MTRHRLINWGLVAAILGLMAGIQQLDAIDETTTAVAMANEASAARVQAAQERREWQTRVSVCHRLYGPQTEPYEAADGSYLCRDRRGRTAVGGAVVALGGQGGAQ